MLAAIRGRAMQAALLALLAPLPAQAVDLLRGERLYNTWCLECHGPVQAPLNATSLNARHSVSVLREGIANARSGMLFLGDVLSAQELSYITAYLGTWPAALEFGPVATDRPSAVRSIELRAGREGLDSLVLTTQGDFVRSGGSCGQSLAAQQACSIEVSFIPRGVGERQGALLISHSGLSTAVALPMTAVAQAPVGNAPGARLFLDPPGVDFAQQTVGQAAEARTVVATNVGGAPLAWLSRTPPLGFSVTDDCGASTAPGAQCRIRVGFTPLVAGPAAGDLVLVTNQAGGDVRLPLSGVGVVGGPRLRWEPIPAGPGSTAVFAATPLGRSATPAELGIRNDGPGTARLVSIRVDGPHAGEFTVSDQATCRAGATLPASTGCTLPVVFSPRSIGDRQATLSVSTEGVAPAAIELAGVGVAAPVAAAATNLGGGGCTIAGQRSLVDPLWFLLLACACSVLIWRRRPSPPPAGGLHSPVPQGRPSAPAIDVERHELS